MRAAAPACSPVRSRKFRVGSGMSRICVPVITSPVVAVWVSTVSMVPWTSAMVETWPSLSLTLTLATLVISTETPETLDSNPAD